MAAKTDTPHDGGMELCGELGSEDDLQEWLEGFFEQNGWSAIREASPHNSRCSADLIVEHDEYGWVGIETKYFHGDGGGKAADAHHQITRKYRGRTYIGERIDLWAICPYFWGIDSPDYKLKRQQQTTRSKFMREMFCRHGIGFVDLNRPVLLIDFAYSQPHAKIPVGGEYASGGGDYFKEYVEDVDIDRIRDAVNRKRERFDYR